MNAQQKSAKEKAEIMLAFARGEKIESNFDGDGWCDDGDPEWNWETFDFRIKKEPRVFYINIYNSGNSSVAHTDRHSANIAARDNRTECIKVVEELP